MGFTITDFANGVTSSKNPVTGKGGMTQNMFKTGQALVLSPVTMMSDMMQLMSNPSSEIILLAMGALVVIILIKK